MKRSLSIILLLAMLLCLAACGETAPAATAAPEATQTPDDSPEAMAAEAERLFYDDADYAAAFEKLSVAEISGFAEVQELLGTYYYLGLGTDVDYDEAVPLLTRAADQGSVPAMYMLAAANYAGNGARKDTDKAGELYRKFVSAAESAGIEETDQYGRVLAYLADCYGFGRGVTKNADKANDYAEKAVAAGKLCALDQVRLVEGYVAGVFGKAEPTPDPEPTGDPYAAPDSAVNTEEPAAEVKTVPAEAEALYSSALSGIRALADCGNVKAVKILGDYSFYGLGGVGQDYLKALEYYTEAGEQGDADAQAQVGYIYQNACGVEADYEKAMEWNNRAAQQGNAQGQAQIGWLYHHGLGVTQNLDEAGRWYTRAADQGNTWAEERLAETEITNPQSSFEAHA